MITYEVVLERLKEFSIDYKILNLEGGYKIICTKRGGRLLGPFKENDVEGLMWINPSFGDRNAFEDFYKSGDWNIGGDRIWVLPEMPFFVKKRTDFYNTYVVQPELDPGNYELIQRAGCVTMSQKVRVNTFENKDVVKNFTITRNVMSAKNPLEGLSNFDELMTDVEFCGFNQNVELEVNDDDKTTYLETWLLSQINPQGKLIVPTTCKAEYVDYYEKIPADRIEVKDKYTIVSVTGDLRYKVGFKASQLTGRSGYVGHLSDGRAYLFFRNYYNDPSNIYCGDTFENPDVKGCSLFFYNGYTAQGGFSEYEHSSKTISGDTGIDKSVDVNGYYFYIGSDEKINKLTEILL